MSYALSLQQDLAGGGLISVLGCSLHSGTSEELFAPQLSVPLGPWSQLLLTEA